MNFYDKYILPKVVNFACSSRPATRQREKVIPLATGRVLEVGIGSGLNLSFYDPDRVSRIWGVEPSPEMRRMAISAAQKIGVDVDIVAGSAENVPVESNSVDTVVSTYTLCTIADANAALREMARVLTPGGRLIFCEHGLAPDARVRRWQDRLNPFWGKLSGGCNLNRHIPALIEQGGFRVDKLETMYLPGWRPGTFNYWGLATPRR